MKFYQSVSSRDVKTMTTDELRDAFLTDPIFVADKISTHYSEYDRLIFGGAMPVEKTLDLPEKKLGKQLGVSTLLENRELGIINIGGEGIVSVKDETYELKSWDALYIGRGGEKISFASINPEKPAKFFINSALAHCYYPNKKISFDSIQTTIVGDKFSSERMVCKLISPETCQSCQLLMGITQPCEGSLWNVMPSHQHSNRMEIYLYFDLEKDLVVHLLGEVKETRHVIIRDEQVVISPSWSIHSGVGSKRFTFAWTMVGENKTFADMKTIDKADLR